MSTPSTSAHAAPSAFLALLDEASRQAAGSARPALLATWIHTPLGVMIAIDSVVAGHVGLVTLDWVDRKGLARELLRVRTRLGAAAGGGGLLPIVMGETDSLARLKAQLGEYFDRGRAEFDVPLAPSLGTPFQERAWAALRGIGAGTTRSYAEQARGLGDPKAVRAVAVANGANFRSIVIPCHRVVGSDGSLVGYGGGIDRKAWLLRHESPGLFAADQIESLADAV